MLDENKKLEYDQEVEMLNHVKLWIYVEMLIGQDSDVAFERNMNSKKIFCENIEDT
jgi:hypothetical protein